jgi:serine/threonine-protein kinase
MSVSTLTLRDLFEACIDRTPAERRAYLSAHCADASLRAHVERLLSADTDDAALFSGGASAAAQAIGEVDKAQPLPPDSRIGTFELLEVLGEGGSSTVFRACREIEGVRQFVALKLLRRGLYSPDAQKQFRRERQALTQLRHSGIARLIEGGVTDSGIAYIALELVEGKPLTEYARERRLNLRQRMALFLQICRAVEAAHRALIVHRDLKPSNVLVADDGQVKLLDFGIAKLLDDTDALQTHLPAFTPAYAAPEQRSGEPITTATDVYALGIVLGELVTGRRLAGDTGRTPSSQVAENTDPGVLPAPAQATRRALRGDLDNIVLKAIANEPERRYASAGALADDVERLLDGRPVAAHPPSRWYRTRKFVLRHRGGVVMALLFVLAITTALGIALWQAQRARMQKQRAEATQAFLVDVFHSNSSNQPDPAKARQTTARQLLDIGAAKIDSALKDAPEGKLELLRLFGGLYDDLSLKDEAVSLRRRQVEVARVVYGAYSDETAAALLDLAGSLNESSFVRELGAAVAQAAAILDAHGDDASPLRGELLRKLSVLYQDTDVPRAIQYAQQSAQVYATLHDAGEQAETLSNLGWLQDHAGAHAQAAVTLQRALDIAAGTGAHSQDLPRYRAYLSDAQFSAMDFGSAASNARAALDGILAINGDEPADTAYFQMRLGKQLARTGHAREAIDLLTRAKATAAGAGGEQPMWAQFMRGDALVRVGAAAEGLPEIDAAIATCRASQPDVVFLAVWLEARAAALSELGRHDEAQVALDEAQQIHARHGEGPATEAGALNAMAQAREALARADAGAAQALLDGAAPAENPATWVGLERALIAADIALARGRPQDAALQAARIRARIYQAGQAAYLPLQLADADLTAGRAELTEGRNDEARPLLQNALTLREQALLPGSPRIEQARGELAKVR